MKGKAIDLGIEGIKCDADGCGYEENFGTWGATKEDILAMNEKWLNTPCPDCGASLLTPEDAHTVELMLDMADMMNDLGNALADAGMDVGNEDDKITVRLDMDGSGEVKLK